MSSRSLSPLRAVLPLLAAAASAAALIQLVVGRHFLETKLGMAPPEDAAVLGALLVEMALGVRVASRWEMRRRDALRDFGLLQLAQAIVALAMVAALSLAAGAFVAAGSVLPSTTLISTVRVLICSVLGLPIALLLGASFVFLSRAFVREDAAERDAGILLSAIAFGAAGGAALAGLVLAPALGFRAAWFVAAGLHGVAGLPAFFRGATNGGADKAPATEVGATEHSMPAHAGSLPRAFFVLFALVGFVAFGIPALWMRAFVFSIGDSVSSRALVLATVACGATIGSASAAMFLRRPRRPLFALAIAQMSAALAIVVTTSFFDDLASLRGDHSLLAERLLACMQAGLVPAILLGMGATLVFGVALRGTKNAAQNIASLSAAILLAGGVGSIAATFLLIPATGIRGALLTMGTISGTAGIFALGLSYELPRARRFAIAAGFAVLFAITASVLPPWNAGKLTGGSSRASSEEGTAQERILEIREGRTATVFVKRSGSDLELNVNGDMEASLPLDLKSDTLLGALPFLYRADAHSALVIGLGTGTTLSVVAQHPLESIECVEPRREILEASPRFAQAWAGAGGADLSKDPRVRVRVESPRSRLLVAGKKYDAIIVSSLSTEAGAADLFTHEFVELCRNRLAEDGVLTLRIHEHSLTTNTLRHILATLVQTLSFADIWMGEAGDLLVTASPTSLPLSFETIARGFDDPATGAALRTAGVGDASIFLSQHLLGPDAVRQLADGARLFIDDRPHMEEVASAEGAPLPSLELLALRTDVRKRISDAIILPPNSEGSARLDRAVQARRLEIEGLARDAAGHTTEALEILRQAAAANPNDLAIRSNLARLRTRIGAESLREQDYGMARTSFAEALQSDPESVDAALGLAELSVIAANSEDALQWAQRALELDPENDAAYAMIGDAHRTAGRWKEARDAYLQALQRFPENVSATLHLAEALTYTGDPEGAVTQIEKARRLGAPPEELERIRKLVRQDG